MKRILVLTLASLIFVSVAWAQFAGGTGTDIDPYIVETAEHLNNVRDYLGAHFQLGADIDLDLAPYNEGDGWEPIGTFTGSFDGNGYVIQNLYINRPGTTNVGLFSYTNAAALENLGLVNVNITGGNNTGGIAGSFRYDCTLVNSYVTGDITGGNYTAGLVGYTRNNANYIGYCYADVNVTADGYAAGIAGYSRDIEIDQTYSKGSVTATGSNRAGGLTGYSYADTIIDSYSTSLVSGYYAGGLVGRSRSGCVITNSYATGMIVGDITGGLVASTAPGTVTNSFWCIDTTGQTSTVGDGTGLSIQEMFAQMSFTDWDFTDVWSIVEGESYPYHVWQGEAGDHNYPPPFPPTNLSAVNTIGVASVTLDWEDPAMGEPDSFNVYRDNDGFEVIANVLFGLNSYTDNSVLFEETYSYYVTAMYGDTETYPTNTASAYVWPEMFGGGSGTEGDPYQIATAEHLDNIRNFVGPDYSHMHYRQTASIDLDQAPYNIDEGWVPIGTSGAADRFYGKYDGNDYIIENLFINLTTSDTGLFGYADSATIHNVTLVNVDVTGGSNTGALEF